tara:strand:+ start:104 stop:811 length:708 start_codon:yes stop_codon:yes gene_type:complete
LKFIFDVDGTLTPSRGTIPGDFKDFLMDFVNIHDVYLVTGSDRDKTIEQVTPIFYNACKRVYNCSGSDAWEAEKNVYSDDWELPKKVEKFLEDELAYSCFPIRNGLHIEHRPGGVNFSILGRGKDPSEGRAEYIKWDKERLERQDIADRIRNHFPELSVALGGQTGLDLGPKGADKSQILRDFKQGDDLRFFGDRMEEGGNDYSLAISIAENHMGYAFHVDSWQDTYKMLKMGIR